MGWQKMTSVSQASAPAVFIPRGIAPDGHQYASSYSNAPATSAKCEAIVAKVKAALQVEPIGFSPSGEVARFNDAWFADARVHCTPRPAVWLSWEHPALLTGAVDMAAGYAAAVLGADRAAVARDLADACRLAVASDADDRHGEVEARLYTVSCDQPPTRDGYVISINAPI